MRLNSGFSRQSEVQDGKIHITLDVASECIQKRVVRYDKTGDNHYDTISAFIKSMRGSDPDAAVYYLAKMLYAGEDVKFIARRIMICASEDVGNADPMALTSGCSSSTGSRADRNAGSTDHFITGGFICGYCSKEQFRMSMRSFAAMDNVKQKKTTVPSYLQDAHYKGSCKFRTWRWLQICTRLSEPLCGTAIYAFRNPKSKVL